jgi:hypothetical protein
MRNRWLPFPRPRHSVLARYLARYLVGVRSHVASDVVEQDQ